MDTMRRLSRLILLTVCMVLASCIDGKEEYWLEKDGSGRAEIRYEIPAAIARGAGGEAGILKMLDEFIRDTPTLTDATRQVTRKDERMMVELKASFKSVLDLIDAVRGESALTAGSCKELVDPLIGQFDIRQSGLSVELTRTVTPSKSLPGSFFMPASQFEGRRLIYILHLPVVAREFNATRTEDDGRTLIWDQPLQEALKKRITMHVNAGLTIPWWLIAVSVAVLGLLSWLGIYGIRRLMGKRR
jgi:hypothetical protein